MNNQIVSKIIHYFKTMPVKKAWIFGSFARNEESDNSDLDLLVEFVPNAKIGLQYFRMIVDLEDICGRNVDLVENNMLHPDVALSVNNERILIYERGNQRSISLKHIVEACERLINFFPNGDIPELNEKDMSYFGLIKNLEIIGEAAYQLTREFVDSHPEIDWRPIIAMRHIMVHGYYKVNPILVREIIQTDVPKLYRQVKTYISQ